jgi:hypothetical protein
MISASELELVVDAVRRPTIPLFAARGRRRFDHVGSAVLLRTETRRFVLMTAGHVLDNVSPDPLLTWGTSQSGAIRLRYRDAISTEPAGFRRRDDRVDLAAFILDSDAVDKLHSVGAVFASELLFSEEVDFNSIYAFVGYPRSVNKVDRAKTTRGFLRPMLPNTVTFAPAQASVQSQYDRVNATTRMNFVAHFDWANSQRSDDPRRPLPDPNGMSGGAVYCFGDFADGLRVFDHLRLVGIGTEYHQREGLFVAANSRSVRHILRMLNRRQEERLRSA